MASRMVQENCLRVTCQIIRRQFVVFDDINSQVLHIKTGVPQGSILGPLLFLIYINEIVKSSNFLKIYIICR